MGNFSYIIKRGAILSGELKMWAPLLYHAECIECAPGPDGQDSVPKNTNNSKA